MLSLKNIKVKYGELTAVHDVSLNIKKGACISLLGVNGAGKSTVLQAIAGTLPISSGSISYCGKNINKYKVSDRVKAGISLVPEGRRIFPLMTVQDNILMGAYTRQLNKEDRMKKIVAKFPVLKEKMNMLAMNLSGGEQQQLAIARALMSKPSLLLLDEPTMGLSPKMCDLVFEFLRDLNKSGITMIISSQETSKAERICDYYININNGKT